MGQAASAGQPAVQSPQHDDDLSDANLLAELDGMEEPLVKAQRLKKEIDARFDECKALVQLGQKEKAIPILREKKLKERELNEHYAKFP